MASQATKMFSKLLTRTDINKRLAIPSKILTSLPGFNENHAVTIHVMYGTKMWQLECSVRKKGYLKPVFSGGLWRKFVICNNFNVGDRITMYKVQDEDGTSSHFMFEVEKPTLSLNDHEVDETSLMMLANVATDTLVDHVITKPSIRVFGTNIGNGEAKSPHLSREKIKFFDADGEACCKFISDQRFSMDLVLGPPIACVEELKLDLTLAAPYEDGYKLRVFAHSKP